MHIAYPLQIDGSGRTRTASEDQQIRHMIEQVLFTAPGERVNRPEFGSGLMQMVFGPNGPELEAATEVTVQSALQQWLGEVIQVEGVDVDSVDSTLRVTVHYMVRRNQQRRVDRFSRPL